MVEIRYWSNTETNNTSSRQSTLKLNTDISVASNPKIFESMMSSMLLSNGNGALQNTFDVNSLFSDFYSSSSILSEREIQSLSEIKDEGMGKVFAARIANQLPVFSQMNSNSNKQNNDIAGLDNLISLNIQQQMIKTRQLIESQTKQIQANQSQLAQTIGSTEIGSLDEFVAQIQSQISAAVDKFDVDKEQIKHSIFDE